VRSILVLVLLVLSAQAQDVVRLRRGGTLRGQIHSRSAETVVLELASGRISIPASEVTAVERDPDRPAAATRKVLRDEWSFLMRNGSVAGWCRVLHWERGEHIQVEEQRTYLPSGDLPRRERRRVEIVDRDGRPREYLWMETVPGGMEVWSGQFVGDRHVRQHRRNGVLHTRSSSWTDGVSLPLPVWSTARTTGLDRVAAVLDPRTGLAEQRRFEANGSPLPAGGWDGRVLPTTAARVALAIEVNATGNPLEMATEAKLHPLTPRDRSRTVHHLPGGMSLRAPDVIWIESLNPVTRGLLMQIENRSTFSRVEVHAFADVKGDNAALVGDLLRTMGKSYDWIGRIGPARTSKGAVTQRIELRQGSERMQAVVRILRRDGGYVAVIGIASVKRWFSEKEALLAILDSATLAK